MKIYASKQVGPIYYMVDDVAVLRTIVDRQLIKTSNKPERGYSNDRSLHHYVSFMRSLDRASRNANKWTYGIQLDGNALSNRYKISPYSFASNAIRGKSRTFRILYMTEYDDGSYVLQLTDRPAFAIPRSVFEDIRSAIINDIEGLNEKKKLEVQQGKRAYRGKTIVTKYKYNVPSGGLYLNENTVSDATLSYLLKHTILNETEERIWILNSDHNYISIRDCITAYIEPKGDESIEQAIDAGYLPPLKIIHY